MNLEEFAKTVLLTKRKEIEKVALFAFYSYGKHRRREFSLNDIDIWFEETHLSLPNRTRLARALRDSKWFRTVGTGYFALHATKLEELAGEWGNLFVSEEPKRPFKSAAAHYVDANRLADLRTSPSGLLDFSKLVRLCEELNSAADNENYFSVALLVRAIIDHVPPVFSVRNFNDVANNYAGTRSFRESMKRLDESSRKIADQHLHTPIRKSEVLPNLTQVDFSNDLDVLLAEVVRLQKSTS
jgi:hypothetical protein